MTATTARTRRSALGTSVPARNVIARAVIASAVIAVIASAAMTGSGPHRTASATGHAGPERILDTRTGTGAPAGRVAPGTPLRLDLPASAGDGAVMLNLTAVDAVAPGHVSVWPCDEAPPPTSVVNVVPGRAVPNTVAVGRSSTGVCLEASAAMHLVADLMAVLDDETVTTGAPRRVLDTRTTGARFTPGEARTVPVPDGGAPLALLNVTAVEASADGFVTAAPCDATGIASTEDGTPRTSTVNFRAGETVAATTFVAVPGGEVCVYASAATHLLVDHFGHAGHDSAVRAAATPTRMLDTRSGLGSSGRATHDAALPVRLAGRAGVPNDAGAAIVTATVIGDAFGHVTVWPCDEPRPETSLLNTWPGAVRANTAIVALSRDAGEMCLAPWTTDGSAVDLLVDVTGWVVGDVPRDPPGDPTASGRFPTLPPGSPLPSGAACADRIRPTPEVRPANTVPNSTRGTAPNGRYPRVDGDFTGTTDEIIQWASCKWGIDTDVVRAQIVKESWWNQSNVGDGGESFGLGQVREPYHQEAFAHDDAIRSSAYNLDYTYAGWRSCYEGNETWLNDFERGGWYEAGDLWGCVGVWFSGRWYVPSVDVYLDGGPTDGYGDLGVRQHLERRTWEHPDFLAG